MLLMRGFISSDPYAKGYLGGLGRYEGACFDAIDEIEDPSQYNNEYYETSNFMPTDGKYLWLA